MKNNMLGFIKKAEVKALERKKELEKSLANWETRRERDFNRYKEAENRLGVAKMVDSQELKDLEECNTNIRAIKEEIETIETMVKSGEYNIGTSYNNDPVELPSNTSLSLANNNRKYIGRKFEAMPIIPYSNEYIASEFQNGVLPEVYFGDYASMIKTDDENTVTFDSDLFYGPTVKDDDKENFEKIINFLHNDGIIKAENKKALQIMREAKDPITISASEVHVAINNNLSARGKLNAVIVVNSDGFAKLDMVDSDGGYPLVKRVGDKFIYHDKYEIKEVSNEELPNDENGKSPIVVGDMSILKFFIMQDDGLIKDEFLEFKVHDRRLVKEIITLSTTSNKAYVWGTLS